MIPALQLADWRRRMADLYGQVRAEDDPQAAWELWRTGRDELFRHHDQSPLSYDDPMRPTGLSYWPYDPMLRFELPVLASPIQRLTVSTDNHEQTILERIGHVVLPPPLDAPVDLWRMAQYGDGLFLPLRDGTAGDTSYGGGRYVIDTAKGAYLGGRADHLIVDLNFAYHPSCRYNSRWLCPLAPEGNIISAAVRAGETL